MDDYRRRPPMEGFSRPGSLGGEAHDDDSVEGHIMDERDDTADTNIRAQGRRGHRGPHQQVAGSPRDDTEGHKARAYRR